MEKEEEFCKEPVDLMEEDDTGIIADFTKKTMKCNGKKDKK